MVRRRRPRGGRLSRARFLSRKQHRRLHFAAPTHSLAGDGGAAVGVSTSTFDLAFGAFSGGPHGGKPVTALLVATDAAGAHWLVSGGADGMARVWSIPDGARQRARAPRRTAPRAPLRAHRLGAPLPPRQAAASARWATARRRP